MQVSSKLLSRTAIVLLGVLLAMVVFVAVSNNQQAGAVTATEQTKILGYVNSYITGQYVAAGQGEAGFVMDAAAVKLRIDSNNNIGALGTAGVLGEGDNAATAPVLVDVLVSTANVIPGTSARCLWSSTTGNGCLEAAQVTTIKNRVNAHEAAGFSTDVVAYCATGHTEAPVTGGLGFIAQTGGLGGSTTPKVYAFKWGRNGWQNTAKTYANANTLGSPTATSTYGASTPITTCAGSTPDSELVRCAAQWAITTGAVGNGVATWATTSGQAIDLRTGTLTGTAIVNATAGSNTVQVAVNSVFNTGLTNINPAATPKKLFVSSTQHVAGIVAEGAEMLGYDSAFLQWGMPNYNSTLNEKWVSSGVVYPVVTATASNLTSGIDVTAPTVSSVSAGSITTSSAVITRVAGEPATMKVQYGTSPGVYTNTVNNTVLNASKTVSLTGLSGGTTYYYKVTSYDGQANSTASTEQSFATTSTDTTPPTVTNVLPTGTIYTSSTTVSAAYSDAGSGINTALVSVTLDGLTRTGCTVTASSVSCPVTGLAVGSHAIGGSVSDIAGNKATIAGSFTVADNVVPVVTYVGPTGTISYNNPTITATATDASPSSGLASASASLNGGAAIPCTISGGNISCLTSGLADGSYSAVVSVTDTAGNKGTASGSFTVATTTLDTTPPTVTNVLPTGTIYTSST
ncbi:MAG: fibronectin type III domain-containing protein, partial [Actinomycetota bacterium]